MTDPTALLAVRELTKTYQTDLTATLVLRGLTLTIRRGEFVAIMGPSGSGKSTLLHILGFLDTPTSGSYHFDGQAHDAYSEEERAHARNSKMGFVFQSFNLLARTSVLENVMLPLLYSTRPEANWQQLATAAVAAVGLEHRLTYDVARLSGGERQRVAIARAIVNEPSIIFADEPTGNLDSKSGAQVMDIISKLNSRGHTVVLITHESSTARYAERIVRMRDGKIERDEAVSDRSSDVVK